MNVYKVYGIVDPSAYGAADRAGTAWTDLDAYKVYGIVDPSAYGAADRAGTAWTDPGVVR